MRGKHMEHKGSWAIRGFFMLLFGAVFIALIGGVVMYLWNAILPRVIGVNPLTYWDALGLLVLCRILFGSFHQGKGKRRGPRKKFARRKAWMEKWSSMSEEEKAEMKDRWRQKCKPARRDQID
ncbi:MAG: hypothetical protein AAF694_24535 [Bacteroidota bacterium]